MCSSGFPHKTLTQKWFLTLPFLAFHFSRKFLLVASYFSKKIFPALGNHGNACPYDSDKNVENMFYISFWHVLCEEIYQFLFPVGGSLFQKS